MRQLALLAPASGAGHRLVAFDDAPFYDYVAALRAARFGVALVLTSQSFDMSRPLGPQCTTWARRVQPSMWIAGNEWNIQGDASWPLDPDGFVEMWNECVPALKAVSPSVPVYTGGMFCGAGTEDLIIGLWPRLRIAPDGVDFHPYLSVPDFARVRTNLGCGISAGEWNDSTEDGIRSFQRTLDTETDHSFFFAYHDGMVPPYGLIDIQGHRKPTWYAYRNALRASLRRVA